ncbi:MAG: protein kinase, partial [Actinomycetota bacterium]
MELGIGGLDHATEIGVGGSAVVYRARQVDLDREVAVKVLSVTDEAFVRRFKREAKTLGKLGQSPSVVTVYDTGITNAGQPYLILELCASSVLEELKTKGPFDPMTACAAGAQVADALAEAHRNGVVHRDIKPGNILLGQTGRYMVTDFGISTVTGSTLGQTNSVGFTASYVAPETLTENEAGPPADVYSLGATLFHMLSGRAPYVDGDTHTNLLALAERVTKEPVPDLRPLGVPDDVCRIIEGAMAKAPADRPTAEQLGGQLRAVLDQPAGSAVPTAAASAPASDITAVLTPVGAGTAADTGPRPDAPPPTTNFAAPVAPTGPAWGGAPPGGQPPPDRGILSDLPSSTVPASQPGDHRLLPSRIEESPRRSPLLLLSAVGLVALLGLAGFLIFSAASGDEDGDGSAVESVEGPTTTLDASGDEAIGSDGNADGEDGPSSTLDPTAGMIEVPTVVGLSADDATDQLLRRGFQVNRVQEETSTGTVGSVIRQSPAAEEVIEERSVVTIVIAVRTPVATAVLPSLAGETAAAATATLEALGLTNLSAPVSYLFVERLGYFENESPLLA